MGKWWTCRTCTASNMKSRSTCGWCKSPFQLMHQSASTPQNPSHSMDCIPPKGGGRKNGKDGSKKGGGRQQQHSSSGQQSPSQAPSNGSEASRSGKGKGGSVRSSSAHSQSIAGQEKNVWQRRAAAASLAAKTGMDVDEDPLAKESLELVERMDTVQALLNSLVGRSDQLSVETRVSYEREMASLRIRKTKLKPLSAQVTVLENLVSRRQSSTSAAEDALVSAQNQLEK